MKILSQPHHQEYLKMKTLSQPHHQENLKMKTLLLAGFMAILLMGNAFSGDTEGNGGDFVRSYFIEKGKEIITDLKTTEKGQEVATKHSLNLDILMQTLSTKVIKLSDTRLYDNKGSAVDAIGTYMNIQLFSNAWIAIFGKIGIKKMVFHEMLRAIGINDQDYLISETLYDMEITRPNKVKTNEYPYFLLYFGSYKSKFHCLEDEFSGLTCNPPTLEDIKTLEQAINDFAPSYHDRLEKTLLRAVEYKEKMEKFAADAEREFGNNNFSNLYRAQSATAVEDMAKWVEIKYIKEVFTDDYLNYLNKIKLIILDKKNFESISFNFNLLLKSQETIDLIRSFDRALEYLTVMEESDAYFNENYIVGHSFHKFLTFHKNCKKLIEDAQSPYAARSIFHPFVIFGAIRKFDQLAHADILKRILLGDDGKTPMTISCKRMKNINFNKSRPTTYDKEKHQLTYRYTVYTSSWRLFEGRSTSIYEKPGWEVAESIIKQMQ